METISALLAFCVCVCVGGGGGGGGDSPVTGESPSQRPVTRNFDFCLNGWIKNRESGDLRRHRAHYDVTLMIWMNKRGLHIQFILLLPWTI